jgi:hypothetical protein
LRPIEHTCSSEFLEPYITQPNEGIGSALSSRFDGRNPDARRNLGHICDRNNFINLSNPNGPDYPNDPNHPIGLSSETFDASYDPESLTNSHRYLLDQTTEA